MTLKCRQCGEELPKGSVRCWKCETEMELTPKVYSQQVEVPKVKKIGIIKYVILAVLLGAGYMYMNSPVHVVKRYYKAAFAQDAGQFLKSFAEEEVERYARKHNLTEAQMKEWAQESVDIWSEQLTYLGASKEDFEFSVPTGYIGKKFAYVKVNYYGDSEEIDNVVYLPVERDYLGRWVLPISDGDYGNSMYDYLESEREKEELYQASLVQSKIPGGDNVWGYGSTLIEAMHDTYEESPQVSYEGGTLREKDAVEEMFVEYMAEQGVEILDYSYQKGKVVEGGQYIHFIEANILGEKEIVLYGIDDVTGNIFDTRYVD